MLFAGRFFNVLKVAAHPHTNIEFYDRKNGKRIFFFIK